jgi:hypothetical protein
VSREGRVSNKRGSTIFREVANAYLSVVLTVADHNNPNEILGHRHHRSANLLHPEMDEQ